MGMDSLQASLDRAMGFARGANYVKAPIHMTPVWEKEHREQILNHIDAYEDVPAHGSEKRAHVGVAGWFNFNVFAKGKHTHLLLIDTNRNQTIFWKDFVALLVQCDTAEQLRQAVMKRCEPVHVSDCAGWMHQGERLPARAGLDEVLFELCDMPWMKDGRLYAHVRKAACEGRILAADANIYDRERLAMLRKWCDAQQIAVTSIYASNIQDSTRDELDEFGVRTLYGVDPHGRGEPGVITRWVDRGVERLTGVKPKHRNLQDVLNRGYTALVDERIIVPSPIDFYRNPLVPDGQALPQLANDERCKIFHSSTRTDRPPLIVLEGAWPVCAADAGHSR